MKHGAQIRLLTAFCAQRHDCFNQQNTESQVWPWSSESTCPILRALQQFNRSDAAIRPSPEHPRAFPPYDTSPHSRHQIAEFLRPQPASGGSVPGSKHALRELTPISQPLT